MQEAAGDGQGEEAGGLLAADAEGVRYPERTVNTIFARRHADTAAWRRYLVDEEFLERRDGEYWRAGGTFA